MFDELISAIEALRTFALTHKDAMGTVGRGKELEELDAQLWARCQTCKLSMPDFQPPRGEHFHSFGSSKLPYYTSRKGEGSWEMHLRPTHNWGQALNGLRAAAEAHKAMATEGTEGASRPSLSPSRQKAYSQYLHAIQQDTALAGATDRDVYDWLENNLDDGEDLPTFATWGKYVREARSAAGENKNRPRAGRDTGRSIVRPDQI
jgi:hypothetical protein